MSINIVISAIRKIFYKNKQGKRQQENQFTKFDVWQTPTKVTMEIMKSPNRLEAYKNYIMTMDKPEEVASYVYDEQTDTATYVTTIISEARDHISRLEDWVAVMEEDGYIIKVESW